MRRLRDAPRRPLLTRKVFGAKDWLNRHSLDFKWTILKREGSHLTMQTRKAESRAARFDRERAHLWTGDLKRHQVRWS